MMSGPPEFNFAHEIFTGDAGFLEAVFGPYTNDPSVNDNDVICVFGDTDIMAHIMWRSGIFKSIGEARKNGWNKPIPPGFTDLTVTKHKVRICIMNKFEGYNPDERDTEES
jgi:hypothetical protein